MNGDVRWGAFVFEAKYTMPGMDDECTGFQATAWSKGVIWVFQRTLSLAHHSSRSTLLSHFDWSCIADNKIQSSVLDEPLNP